MARSDEGLRNEQLKSALEEARQGQYARLEDLLARHGAMPSPRPNLRLAAAFGAELSALSGELVPLLARLAADDSAPNEPRVFLPIAATYGFVGRIRAGREVEASWRHLLEVAADERAPVRIGALNALMQFGAREGGADELVRRGAEWLEASDDRELKFGSAALMLEVLSDAKVMATLKDEAALFAYVSSAIDAVADAPRAAERSEGRRRVLMSLPAVLAAIVVHLARGEAGARFFQGECERAEHPDVRAALSDALQKMRASGQAQRVVEELQKSLEASAKPLRYAALVRPGTGRGKRSRRTR